MGESICAEKFLARGSVYFRKIMYICMWNPVCLEHYYDGDIKKEERNEAITHYNLLGSADDGAFANGLQRM